MYAFVWFKLGSLAIYCRCLPISISDRFFMAAQSDLLQDALSGYSRDDLTAIIDRLAGGKDNLRVDFKNVKFTLRDQTFDVNGVVDFKVCHSVSNAHVVVKEIVKKYG